MQRPVDSDGNDHSMTGMLASIPPSISLSVNRPISGFNTMLENHHDHHNVVFDTMLTSSNDNILPVKRSLPGLFWTEETHTSNNSPYTKRFLTESNNDGSVMVSRNTEENSSSIASLLGQLPQTTPQMHHQQAMLGYQLPGTSWY